MTTDHWLSQREPGARRVPGPRRAAARPSRHDLNVEVCFETHGDGSDELRESVLACRRLARDALNGLLEQIVRLRGHDPASACRRELTGRLNDLPLFDLMQTVAMGHRSAVIDVRDGNITGRIWCSNGEIIDCTSGCLKGVAAAHRILALQEGELCADFRLVTRPRVIRESMQALVMEAARRKDECAELEKHLGGPDLVWWASPAVPRADLDDAETSVLQLLSHGARLDCVLAQSTLGDLETLRAFMKLVQRGSIRSRSGPRRAAPSTPPEDSFRTSFDPAASWFARHRWSLAAAAAFGIALALLVVTWVRFQQLDSLARPTSHGRAIEVETHPARPRSPPPAATPASQPTAPAAPFPAASEYPLRVTVEPPDASLWLDGGRLATGELTMALPRDGRTHELEIRAPGYRPQTFLFQDLSPPRAVLLEPSMSDPATASNPRAIDAPPGSRPRSHAPEPRAPR